jgi:hypothetical protein
MRSQFAADGGALAKFVEKEEALDATESQIAELAKSANLPAQ